MKIRDQLQSLRTWPKDWPLQVIPRVSWADQRPTYRDAQPAVIDAALRRSQHRPTGNWYPFAASRHVVGGRPFGALVAGVEVVAWRDEQHRLCVGPRSCPHLGADLATGTVHRGTLVCRWHGLTLDGRAREFGWSPLPGHDDGTLVWVRLDAVGREPPLELPVIPDRPTGDTLAAVARMEGVCEPIDVIANRLDPWHGAWFHPYSFTRLEVLTTPTEHADRFLVAVTFRMGRLGCRSSRSSAARRPAPSSCASWTGRGRAASSKPTPPQSVWAPMAAPAPPSWKPPSRTRGGPGSSGHPGWRR